MKAYKKILMAAALVAAASQAAPAQAGVNFNLNIGVPVAVAAVPAPPLPPPPRAYMGAPEFIFSPSLGIYVSMGTPVDIFYTGGNYYRYDRGYWYSSPRYNGHWKRAHLRGLPPELTRHRYEQIRYYRDRDCRHHLEVRKHGRDHWKNHGVDDRRGGPGDRGRGHGDHVAKWHGERGR